MKKIVIYYESINNKSYGLGIVHINWLLKDLKANFPKLKWETESYQNFGIVKHSPFVMVENEDHYKYMNLIKEHLKQMDRKKYLDVNHSSGKNIAIYLY